MSDTNKKRSADEIVDNVSLYDDQNELINAVISVLAVPENKTVVAEKYANDKNQATEVQAYAKIAGNNWTFYVKSLSISIGRNTEPSTTSNAPKENEIDIDLGPAKVVSRQHASINYNLNSRMWELYVGGRNGAKIDGARIPCGQNSTPSPLYSGAVIDIGGTQMMFILPDAQPKISKTVLDSINSKLPKPKNKRMSTLGFSSNNGVNIGGQINSSMNNTSHFGSNMGSSGIISSIPSTNSNLKGFQMYNNTDSDSESQNGGSKNSDNDLSKDESRDIKPPYSYATMITQAILSNQEGVLSLSEIYDWISNHYAYYRFSKSGWQNSIRHNLSLNKAFEKVPRRANEPGKGMKWQIADSYKAEFLKKFQNGSLSKVRRGSSVSRQLQLHLAMHNDLPASQAGFRKVNQSLPPNFSTYPQQGQPQGQQSQQGQPNGGADALSFMAQAATTHSYPQYQGITQGMTRNIPQGIPQSLPQGNQMYAQGYYMPPQLPPLHQQQQQASQPPSQPGSIRPSHSQPLQPQQQQPQSQASNDTPQSAYPEHIPTAPQSAHFPSSTTFNSSNNNGIRPSGSEPTTGATNTQNNTTNNTSITSTAGEQTSTTLPKESESQLSSPLKSERTPVKNSYYNGQSGYLNEDENIVSPVKTFVSAVEAYTPDRGAKPSHKPQDSNQASNHQRTQSQSTINESQQQNGEPGQSKQENGSGGPGGPGLQSSPALWNFVQFSTPLQPKEQTTPTKSGYHNQITTSERIGGQAQGPESPLVMRQKVKDLGDLSNVDLAKGFKK